MPVIHDIITQPLGFELSHQALFLSKNFKSCYFPVSKSPQQWLTKHSNFLKEFKTKWSTTQAENARNYCKSVFLSWAPRLKETSFFFHWWKLEAYGQKHFILGSPETPTTTWGSLGSQQSLQMSWGRQPNQHHKQSGDQLLHLPVERCTFQLNKYLF